MLAQVPKLASLLSNSNRHEWYLQVYVGPCIKQQTRGFTSTVELALKVSGKPSPPGVLIAANSHAIPVS